MYMYASYYAHAGFSAAISDVLFTTRFCDPNGLRIETIGGRLYYISKRYIYMYTHRILYIIIIYYCYIILLYWSPIVAGHIVRARLLNLSLSPSLSLSLFLSVSRRVRVSPRTSRLRSVFSLRVYTHNTYTHVSRARARGPSRGVAFDFVWFLPLFLRRAAVTWRHTRAYAARRYMYNII